MGGYGQTSLTVFPVTIDDALLREIVSHEAALTPMQILMTL